MPVDYQRVLIQGRELGIFVGSRSKGKWRVHTPLTDVIGRKVMVFDCEEPDYWMPIDFPKADKTRCVVCGGNLVAAWEKDCCIGCYDQFIEENA